MRWIPGPLVLSFVLSCTSSPAQPPNAARGSVFASFPVPAPSKDLLFYIQRNKNANTILYEVQRGPNGQMDPEEPVLVSWIRYTEGGHREPLNLMERSIAYGVSHKHTQNGMATMKFVASDRYPFIVQIRPGGQAEAWVMLKGRMTRLQYIHVQAVENAWRPKVAWVELHGVDIATGAPVTERYTP